MATGLSPNSNPNRCHVVTPAAVTVNTTGLSSSSGHLIAGTHTGVESVSALSGADAGNYTFAGLTGNYTVNVLALNATMAAGNSTYGSALVPGAASGSNKPRSKREAIAMPTEEARP